MPFGTMSPEEIYNHVRQWVDSFYQENQQIFHDLSEIERSIEQFQEKSKIPLVKIQKWQSCCQRFWDDLRIIANFIHEVITLKENDRDSFVKLLNKYKKKGCLDNVIKNFEKDYGNWQNLDPIILETLLKTQKCLDYYNVGFKCLHSQLKEILKEQNFYKKHCEEIINIALILNERDLIIENSISEYLNWWKKRINNRLGWKKFRTERDTWRNIIDNSSQSVRIRDEFEYIFQFIRKFPLSINSAEAAEVSIIKLAEYYKINSENQQWLAATKDFRNLIINYINTLQETCPKWLIENTLNITIHDAVPLDNELGGDGNIDNLPENHPIRIAIFNNTEALNQENEVSADKYRTQCLEALQNSIKKYTLTAHNFIKCVVV
jgi:hypothetical protein